MATRDWLFALNEIERSPGNIVKAGRCFKPEDADERDSLLRLLAAREASKEEVAIEEDRLKDEEAAGGVSRIQASTQRTKVDTVKSRTTNNPGDTSAETGDGDGGDTGDTATQTTTPAPAPTKPAKPVKAGGDPLL